MTYNDGTWTDEKPEVGKRYWVTSEFRGRWLKPWKVPRVTKLMRDSFSPSHLRSVHPIPDPTPPPLPSKEPR